MEAFCKFIVNFFPKVHSIRKITPDIKRLSDFWSPLLSKVRLSGSAAFFCPFRNTEPPWRRPEPSSHPSSTTPAWSRDRTKIQEAAEPAEPGWPRTSLKEDGAKLSGSKTFIYLRVLAVKRDPEVKAGQHLPFPESGKAVTPAPERKVTVGLLLSLLQGGFCRASGLLLDGFVLQWLSRAVVAFCLLKPPRRAGSREALGALAVPSIRTHLRFSSCDPGRTLSGRSRLLLYRPDCDNSFSCKAVIFPYLEEGWFF